MLNKYGIIFETENDCDLKNMIFCFCAYFISFYTNMVIRLCIYYAKINIV